MPVFSDLFPILFVIVAAVIAIVIVVIIVQAVASVRRVRRAGHNPLTLHADLATKLLDSQVLSREKPTEERLAELERLRQAQVISGDEYAQARARVLADH
ncbi:MAG: hypothetical protein Q7T71_16015 [Herbiconiux sp.]|nr:hypothetical protein [Herbiconiux sp.]